MYEGKRITVVKENLMAIGNAKSSNSSVPSELDHINDGIPETSRYEIGLSNNTTSTTNLTDVIQLFNQWCKEDVLLSPDEIESFLNKSNSNFTISMFLKLLEQDLNENIITLDTNLRDYVQTLVQGVEVNLELPLLDEANE